MTKGSLNELALFAGAGGGILGGVLLGWRTIGAVEISAFCARRLMQRQNDGHLPPFPIWDDVCTFDGRPWCGVVDVISGGFPCQDISSAGKGAGLAGSRSGLWREYARIIGEVVPRYVFIENSPLLRTRGLVRVLQDLAALGYDAEWMVLSAKEVGADHLRKRMWIVAANTKINGWRQRRKRGSATSSARQQEQSFQVVPGASSVLQGKQQEYAGNHSSGHCSSSGASEARCQGKGATQEFVPDANECASVRGQSQTGKWEISGEDGQNNRWWAAEPDVGRVANGVAARLDRLRAIGNGQVPAVAATAWRILSAAIEEGR